MDKMIKKDKLIKRLKKQPKDFTYEEGKKVLEYLGYIEDNKGKASGSRIIFVRERDKKKFLLHKPHPDKVMKQYAVKQLKEFVEKEGV